MNSTAVLTRPSAHNLRLLRPGGSDYEEARTVWNAMVDHRPAAIAPCRSAEEVRAAVAFAREADLEIGVRCGGHNVAGLAVPDGGLMIDLRPLSSTRADAARIAPFARGAYVNALSDEGQSGVRQAYGAAKLDRLRALKNFFDPTNVFHLNHNIAPSGR